MTKIVFQYILAFFAAFFIYPTATKEYYGFWNGFYLGTFHGSNVINLSLFSVFSDDHLVKAIKHGTAYNIGWYFGILLFIYGACFTIYKIFKTLERSGK